MPKPGEKFNPFKVFVGLFIPNALARYKKISANAKLLYGRLAQFAGKDGRCFPSQALMAEEIGVTERAVRKLLKELKENGFIAVTKPGMMERFNGNTAGYDFIWHPIFEESLRESPSIGTNVPMESIGTSIGTSVPVSIGTLVPVEENHIEENHRRESRRKECEVVPLFPTPVFYKCEFFVIDQSYHEELQKEFPLIDFMKLFKKLRDKILDEPKRYKRNGRGQLKSLRQTVRNWCEREIIWREINGSYSKGDDPIDRRARLIFRKDSKHGDRIPETSP